MMRKRRSIVVGVVLSLLFVVLPAHAAAPFVGIALGASGLSAAHPSAPVEIGRHRTKLPNGSVYDYDYSFPAQLRILEPDGKERVEEATCYIKSKTPPSKGKKPPTKEDLENAICAVALGGTVWVACTELTEICEAGGVLVFPAFCGGLVGGCVVAELAVGGIVTAGICKPDPGKPATDPPPASTPPPSSQMFWDIAPGSDLAPQFTPNLPAGGEIDAIPEGRSWWDVLQQELQQQLLLGEHEQTSYGSDSVGDGVTPDNGAVTNGVSGVSLGGSVSVGPGGYIVNPPDPNDDPGEPGPDVGGGE